jgi:hypothetical protein
VVLGRGRTGLLVGETLKVDREHDSDGFAGKATSGGDVKAPLRREEGEPGGGEAQEGIGQPRRLITDGAATDPDEEEALKAGRRFVACGGQPSDSGRAPTTRGNGPSTRRYGFVGGKTPEERTLDVAVGRNKPTKPMADETVEGVRNAEDGTVCALGSANQM